MSEQTPPKKSFKDTLNLPTTTFPIRANSAIIEPEILAFWQAEDVFAKSLIQNKGKKKFVVPVGPPYANGPIHMGHALQATLKDAVSKIRRMEGYQVPLVWLWDCHGLPIEHKVMNEQAFDKDPAKVDPVALRKACFEYATGWIKAQGEQTRDLGVLADWAHPYSTMDKVYESKIVSSFAQFVRKGYIKRRGKAVPWCKECRTVLASAEIEYQDRKDPSLHIFFPLAAGHQESVFASVVQANPGIELGFLIWTTTPWTVPLNRAVAIHPKAEYALVKLSDTKAFIIGKERVDAICGLLNIEKNVLAVVQSTQLASLQVQHPFETGRTVPVILEDSVGLTDGTAVVHSAPGCGPDDYIWGIKNKLEVYSPLSADGCYTAGIFPQELEGMSISDGQIWVIKQFAARGTLIHKASLNHSYPHCWRCHQGLMYRATMQWFCDLEHEDLIARSLKEAEKIKFYPESGQVRFSAALANRKEWCLSRQRHWGVPIPALICKKCDTGFTSGDFVQKVADGVALEGIEFWTKLALETIFNQGYLPQGFACFSCGAATQEDFKKEKDIIDVWFESGVAHEAFHAVHPELTNPVDLYIEGSDQHRAWFQTSLLTSMVTQGKAPMRGIMTAGFVVDANGRKMSKSIGNVIAPDEVIKKYGRDILRLWVAFADFENDIVISENVLQSVAEVYRKIRNTCRFMLSNLYNFDIEKDGLKIEELEKIDQFALQKLYELNKEVRMQFDQYRFTMAFQAINAYCTNDLSALYFDIVKDTLYVEGANSQARRSVQTVLYYILDTLTRLIAPIMSFSAEEIARAYQKPGAGSIHLQSFAEPISVWRYLEKTLVEDQLALQLSNNSTFPVDAASYNRRQKELWKILLLVRDAVLKAIEPHRAAGLIKLGLEAKITLWFDKKTEEGKRMVAFISEFESQQMAERFFAQWCIVSQCSLKKNQDELALSSISFIAVKVEHALGQKCLRCWQWHEAAVSVDNFVCERCLPLVG